MSESFTPPATPPDDPSATVVSFRDRRTALRVVGAIQLLFAALVFMLTLFIVGIIASMPNDLPGASAYSMYMGVGMYGGMATALLALGIGACATKRWGVALGKVFWGTTVLVGLLSIVTMFTMVLGMPGFYDNPEAFIPPGQEPPETRADFASAMKFGLIIGAVFNLVFLVLIPLAFFLFYRGRDVYLTAQHYDPNPSWTDRVPTPLLAGALFCVFSATMMLLTGFAMPIAVLGNQVIQGPPATALYVVFALVMATLAWGFFKRHRVAWYGAWGWIALMAVYQVVLVATGGYELMLEAMYAQQNMPEAQIEMSKQFASMPFAIVSGLLWSLGAIVYLLYTRRYFFPNDDAAPKGMG